MRLVRMNGGLGNQAFQYIFLRYLEEKTGAPCVIEDLFFYKKTSQHNGYELDRVFSIQHPRLSDLLDKAVIQEMAGMLWPENGQPAHDFISIFHSCGIDLTLIQEDISFSKAFPEYKGTSYSLPLSSFDPVFAQLNQDNLYFYGYWINAHWFLEIMDTILKELMFPPLPDERNKSFYQDMKTSTQSVAVHIRRGDFITLGWTLEPQFYVRAIGKMRQAVPNPVFYIFSDDISYVKTHMEEYGFSPQDTYVFMEGNTGRESYIDMQLMSVCRGMIIANSAFSYLGALLNRREDKLVCNPTDREIV